MSEFITIDDYDSTVHREILDSLIREDEALVEVCEDQAIAEMKGYLKLKYDVDAIFAKRGSDRHPLVLMFAKDIALYHVFSIHNPMKMSEIRKSRYDAAIEWLKLVSKGDVIVDGADEYADTDTTAKNDSWQMLSNPLLPTHF